MKFNAAFGGEGNLFTWPRGSFKCSPGEKKIKRKPIFSSDPGQFISLKTLHRIFFPLLFSVWSTVKCPAKPLPLSVTVGGRASLALPVLAGERRTRTAVWVVLGRHCCHLCSCHVRSTSKHCSTSGAGWQPPSLSLQGLAQDTLIVIHVSS